MNPHPCTTRPETTTRDTSDYIRLVISACAEVSHGWPERTQNQAAIFRETHMRLEQICTNFS